MTSDAIEKALRKLERQITLSSQTNWVDDGEGGTKPSDYLSVRAEIHRMVGAAILRELVVNERKEIVRALEIAMASVVCRGCQAAFVAFMEAANDDRG